MAYYSASNENNELLTWRRLSSSIHQQLSAADTQK